MRNLAIVLIFVALALIAVLVWNNADHIELMISIHRDLARQVREIEVALTQAAPVR